MQKEIRLKSRRCKWRWIPDCFRGTEAVAWLVERGEVSSREAAVAVGAEMLGRGLIFHVNHRHGFQDKKNRLYRFNYPEGGSSETDESDAASIASSVSLGPKRVIENYECQWSRRAAAPTRLGSAKADKWSIGKELTSLQGRVLDLDIDIEDQKEMQGILLDAIASQMRGMQAITQLLQDKIVSTRRRVADLELWLATSAALQVVFLLFYCGFPILATAFLVLAGNVGYIWHQSREPVATGEGEEEKQGGEDQWTGPGWIGAAMRDCGDLPFSGPMNGGHSGGGHTAAVAGSSSDESGEPLRGGRHLPGAPSMTIRQIREGSREGMDFHRMASRGASVTDRADSYSQGRPHGTAECHLQSRDSGSTSKQPPTPGEMAESPDAPLLMRPKKGNSYPIYTNLADGAVPLNIGRRLHFESESFKGCVVVWVQGLPNSPPDLFANRNRKSSITVQGVFRRPSGLDDICTGQEFSRAPTNLPPKWLVESVLIKIARSISPSMSIGPLSHPYLLVPMVAAAQVVNVSLPGDEPDPSREVPENMTLFDDTLVDSKGAPLAWSKRQKVFRNAKARNRLFTEDHVWTFTIYQSQVDLASYSLDVGLRFDLTNHLDGQPLQFMMKDRSRDSYLFNFEAWHEKLLPAAQAAWQASQDAA